MTTLDQVAEISGGGTPSRADTSYFGGAILWATPTDVTALDDLYIERTKETLTPDGLARSSAKLLPAGAVLLTSRATIGFTAVSKVPISTNQGFVNFVCGPKLQPEYLAYWLRAKKPTLERLANGATFKEISRGTVRKLEIDLPERVEQARVVDLLSRAENIVRMRREAEKKAKEIIPALFLDMFGDPVTNPRGWEVNCLSEIVTFVSGGTPSKARDDYWRGLLPWVSPKDMKVAEIFDAEDHISDQVPVQTSIKLIAPGAVLIVVRGMILAHTVPVAITRAPVTINQDMKALRPKNSISSEYLMWLLRISQQWLLTLVSSAAHGTRKIDTARLEALRIPVPPRAMQESFVQRVGTILSVNAGQNRAAERADQAFQSLLAGVFSEGVEI